MYIIFNKKEIKQTNFMAVSNRIIGLRPYASKLHNLYKYNHEIHYEMYKFHFPERVNNAYLLFIYYSIKYIFTLKHAG